MTEIGITLDGKVRQFYAAPHFDDRFNERTKGIELSKSVLNAVYIAKRPDSLRMVLKHGLRSFYLWDDTNKLVYVIEENSAGGALNILKTVYTSLESEWLLKWQAMNPKVSRKRFCEVFNDDKVFR